MCGESVTCGGRGDVLRVCWRGRITCVHGEGVVCVCLGCAWQKCGGRVQRVWREGAACVEGGGLEEVMAYMGVAVLALVCQCLGQGPCLPRKAVLAGGAVRVSLLFTLVLVLWQCRCRWVMMAELPGLCFPFTQTPYSHVA